MAWVVYSSDGKTSGAYADLPTARKRAQEEANRTRVSAIVYPTSRTGRAKGKTHHVKPNKRTNPLSVGLPRNKWVNARIRVTSGGKIQATVDENILGNLLGKGGGKKRNPSIQTQVFTDKNDAELFARLLRGKGRKVVLKLSRGKYRVKWVSPEDRIPRRKR